MTRERLSPSPPLIGSTPFCYQRMSLRVLVTYLRYLPREKGRLSVGPAPAQPIAVPPNLRSRSQHFDVQILAVQQDLFFGLRLVAVSMVFVPSQLKYHVSHIRPCHDMNDLVLTSAIRCQTSNHSHSIINRPPKPAWLKGLAVIDMGHYRRFYRHPTRALSGAEDEGI